MRKFIQNHYASLIFGITFFIGFLYAIFWNDYQIDAFVYLIAASMATILLYDNENSKAPEDKYDTKRL